MAARHRLLGLVLLAAAVMSGAQAIAQETRDRIEIVEVQGIIDGSVERMILSTIEQAEREDAELVLLQIDSLGVLGSDRGLRIVDRIGAAEVPVGTWVGPGGARAANAAAAIADAGHLRAMAPGARIGPVETMDLREEVPPQGDEPHFAEALGADEAEEKKATMFVEPSLRDVLTTFSTRDAPEGRRAVDIDPDTATIRFHELDLLGRILHGAAQPSISYLLLLLGLIGIVFELFHPSTGPAGVSGLAALALGLYGVATLGGWWPAVAVIAAGVAAFCIDLRYESLGLFSAGGLIALVAGSLLLYRSPWLRIDPGVLAFGVIGMTMFLVGAMTRVLRDLRAIARGELEVRDAHEHPEGDHHDA